MFTTIVFLILAIVFGYFATQNTELISITLANYTLQQIPMYIVLGVTFLLGLAISWILSLIDNVFVAFQLKGKDSTINEARKTILDLTKKVNQLELENAKLEGKLENDVLQEDSL